MEAAQIVYYVVAVLSTGVSAIAGALAWNASRAVKNANIAAAAAQVGPLKELVDKQHLELTEHRARIRTLEKQVAALPTETMLAQIGTSLARLEGQINTLGVKTDSAAKSADAAMEAANRIEGFFIQQGIKST